MKNEAWLVPPWDAPASVHALITTRAGGVSVGPYASFNLADHVGDEPAHVEANRARLRASLPSAPVWLKQVHGAVVVNATLVEGVPEADAAYARAQGIVCAVLTADCLPVFFCDDGGSVVAAAHAGWRGLAAGVLEATVRAMEVDPSRLLAWLGPAIGPEVFEVGEEVRTAFLATHPPAASAFVSSSDSDFPSPKYLADIYALARLRLAAAGVARVSGGECCTFTDAARFYSYRRDHQTGRMASLIWLGR